MLDCIVLITGLDGEMTIITFLPDVFHPLFIPFHLLTSSLHLYFRLFFVTPLLNYIHAFPSIKTSLHHPFSSLLLFYTHSLALSFHLSLGQRDEPGTGPPAFEQPPGRGPGTQTASGPVNRDLCPGHWQHAAQSVSRGLVCSGLPRPSGATTTLCDHLPPGESRGRKDTGCSPWQDLAPALEQCHHALYPLQTQGAKRGALPAESSQDTHANVLPTSTRRTHPRNQ